MYKLLITSFIALFLVVFSSFKTYGGTIPFVTTWLVDNEEDFYGVEGNNQVYIPTDGGGYNYTVDWGDSTTTNHTGAAAHTYTAPGVYTVSITGVFPRINFRDKSRLLSIEQWGNNIWDTMKYAFSGCYNLQGNFTDTPNLSNVKNMSNMFNGARKFNYYIGNWDVSNVTNMQYMFYAASSFNQNLNNWDVSKVVNMEYMFSEAVVFNQSINNWDVSKVNFMEAMFSNAKAFNQNIDNWNVGNVTNMKNMFYAAGKFNQSLNNWDVSKVTAMDKMFHLAVAFNGDIGNWNVGNVKSMFDMFSHAFSFNQDISRWNVSRVIDMKGMFYIAKSFNQNIGQWNVSRVKNMRLMFAGAVLFDQDLGHWNISSVMDMASMFTNVTLSITNYDSILTKWSKLKLRQDITFHGGYSQYCAGTAAKAKIISTYNWNIIDGGSAAPVIDNLENQEVIDNYTLPIISGEKLSNSEKYYTGTNATGSVYNIGDVINFYDFPSYPITLYIYDSFTNANDTCSTEQSFELTINTSSLPCVSLINPTPYSTNILVDTDLTWNSVAGAEGYKLSIGTSSNKTNILETTDVGNILNYKLPMELPENLMVFVNITPYNTITENTSCQESFTTEPIRSLNIPKYFTPNDDGYHDTWVVPNPLNKIAFIHIYDRYGKLLKQITDISNGWDGVYLNKLLPTNDYWYTIQYKDGEILNGHFSLKR